MIRPVVRTAACLAPAALSSCLSFGSHSSLYEYSLATPARALDSFKKALELEDDYYQYLALSEALKSEQDLTFNTYQLGRDPFLRRHPREYKLFLKSEIKETRYSADGREAVLTLEADGETAEAVLRNEPFYEVVLEDDTKVKARLAQDPSELARARGSDLVVIVPLAEPLPPGRIVDCRVSRAWKFYRFLGIERFDFSDLERAPRDGQTEKEESRSGDEP